MENSKQQQPQDITWLIDLNIQEANALKFD